MAGRLLYERMKRLSTNSATRATQLSADHNLWMYCLHSLYRQYVILFGVAPPPITGAAMPFDNQPAPTTAATP